MKKLLVAGLVAVVGLASPACNRSSSRAAGRLTVDGRAEVATVGGSLENVTRSRTLKAGEQVTMVEGTAVLSLGEGRSLELRKGTIVRLGLQRGPLGKEVARGELVSGDVLVQASNDPATVVAGDSTVEVNPLSVARVSRRLAVVVGVYRGAAGVESAGRPASVPALRQRTVPAPGLPSRPTPITFDASDPWDQRFLGDAIDLGNQLVATSRGFTPPSGYGPGSPVSLFLDILPRLAEQPGFSGSLIDTSRAPGETLVGAAISLEGSRSTFPERWASVFGFHDDGAPWGLVALDQGASREPLLATIDGAIRRLSGSRPELAGPGGTPPRASSPASVPVPSLPSSSGSTSTASGSAPTGSSAGGTTSSGGTGTGGTSSGGTGTGGSATTLAPYERVTGPSNLGIPLVDTTVNSVVDALSGVLRAIGRS